MHTVVHVEVSAVEQDEEEDVCEYLGDRDDTDTRFNAPMVKIPDGRIGGRISDFVPRTLHSDPQLR